jgi:hypothetical protein
MFASQAHDHVMCFRLCHLDLFVMCFVTRTVWDVFWIAHMGWSAGCRRCALQGLDQTLFAQVVGAVLGSASGAAQSKTELQTALKLA